MNVNDIVYMAANHDYPYGRANPLTVSGTVVANDFGTIKVRWSNGEFNSYFDRKKDLISKVQPSRDIARVEARRNPNLTVKKIDGQWVLELKERMVVNDGGHRK